MSVDRILQLKLIADVSDINKKTAATTGKVGKLSRSVGNWGKALALGLVIEGVEEVTKALGNAWEGFREGEQAAGRLGNTWTALGMDAAGLDRAIQEVSDSAKALGTDDVAAIDAFNKALLATGDQEAAMKRLKIAQDLVAAGMATDLTGALKLVDGAAKGSTSTVRKFGLSADTAGGRVKELGRKVKGAADKKADLDPLGVLFNSLNEDLEGIVGSLASGDIDGALASLGQVGADLKLAWDAIAPKITETLDNLTDGRFSQFIADFVTPLVSNLQSFIDKVLPVFNSLLADAGEKLGILVDEIGPKVEPFLTAFYTLVGDIITALGNFKSAIQPVIDILFGAASGTLGAAMDAITGFMNTIIALLNGDFTTAWNTITETVQGVVDDVSGIIGGLVDGVAGLIPGMLTAATDVGGALLDGIVAGVAGLANAIVSPFRDGLNAIIRALNEIRLPALTIDISAFSIPNPLHGTVLDPFGTPNIQVVGASKFQLLPEIDPFNLPMLASGGIVTKPTIAMIGEAGPEAVVPLDEYGAGGGVTLNMYVTGDPAVVEGAVLKALRRYANANGSIRLDQFRSLSIAR